MPGPLEGIKVVELGVWVAGPAATAILAEWGADVVKIEPPEGDPFRGIFASLIDAPSNPPFELDNRKKRSIVLDLTRDEAQAIASRLVDEADVFLTNMRPRVLARHGLGYDTCSARNPGLVYCQVTGYGPDHEEANRAAYDVGAFWSRAGVARMLMPNFEGNPPQQRGGMGDHMTATNAAGAVAAALFSREKTGRGQRVAVSLVRVGLYMMGWDMNTSLSFGALPPPADRFHSPNPMIDCFQSSDGRWFWLLLLQADRHWPDLLRAIEAPALAQDPRFKDIATRRENAEAFVHELDAIFATRTLEQWSEAFDRENVWFAVMNTIDEAAKDPLVHAAGGFVEVHGPDGSETQVAMPVDFYGTPPGERQRAPELGQNTEEILLELGYDWDGIIALKEKGAIL